MADGQTDGWMDGRTEIASGVACMRERAPVMRLKRIPPGSRLDQTFVFLFVFYVLFFVFPLLFQIFESQCFAIL